MRAIATLCEGVSPRKVARIFEVDKDTVFGWLVEAAKHSEAVIGYMMHDLHLTRVQMDEELVSDMIALVTSFAGRLYGRRSHKTKEIVACVSKKASAGL